MKGSNGAIFQSNYQGLTSTVADSLPLINRNADTLILSGVGLEGVALTAAGRRALTHVQHARPEATHHRLSVNTTTSVVVIIIIYINIIIIMIIIIIIILIIITITIVIVIMVIVVVVLV